MYTSLEEAKVEVWRRWNDPALRNRVADYLEEVPSALLSGPRAVMFRQVVSPNFEAYELLKASRQIELKPYCFEYFSDRFCTRNLDKVLLGKMTLLNGRGKNGGKKIQSNYVIDFEQYDMHMFSDILTNWGEEFIAFHHRITERCLPDIDFSDNTAWFVKMGGAPSIYYEKFISLFICHGVLFENFIPIGDEGRFTLQSVYPAIEKVTSHFGLKPLIVRLLPAESEADPYWCWYPGHLEAEVRRLTEGSASGTAKDCAGKSQRRLGGTVSGG